MTTRPDTLAIVALHRIDGHLQSCRRYVVHCIPCQGTSFCLFHQPGPAGDAAREHLAVMHGIAPIRTTTSTEETQ